MRLAVILEVLTVLGAVSFLAGVGSLLSTALRRWPLARRLSFVSMGAGLAAPMLSCLTVVPLGMPGSSGLDAASKAMLLAGAISELMNCTVLAVPGTLLGLIALGVVSWREPRQATDAR